MYRWDLEVMCDVPDCQQTLAIGDPVLDLEPEARDTEGRLPEAEDEGWLIRKPWSFCPRHRPDSEATAGDLLEGAICYACGQASTTRHGQPWLCPSCDEALTRSLEIETVSST